MQAIILAAGMGKRLKEHTKDKTKCMVKINGVTLIERALRILDRQNFTRIIIVGGYCFDGLKSFVSSLSIKTPVQLLENKSYETTNNIYSLGLVKEQMAQEDTIVIESDILFEERVIQRLLDSDEPCVTFVAKPQPWMDGVLVTLTEDGKIASFIGAKDYRPELFSSYYKTVSMYRFSKEFAKQTYLPFLEAYLKSWGDTNLYESALKVVALQQKPMITAMCLETERWYEINDIQDIDIAESIFAEGEERLNRYLRRYGGYWRYHGMYDFCYLVNPFFPNERFINEMKANFDTLIREYPSGMAVNSLLAAKYFEVRPEQICVGNGTAELIKSLMECLEGKMGMAYPTFEEYPHRRKAEDVIPFYVKETDFQYTVDDLMTFYDQHPVKSLVLVNPDNPTGHFIPREDILRLEGWGRSRGTRIIVDESFVDFADGGSKHSLLDAKLLDEHPSLLVIKSISKSFGVAGLRLGIIATADTELIAFMKKDVAIWNINSFAEYYMQIIEKYKDDYEDAVARFRKVRERYLERLHQIKGLLVYPSQANYVMCRILTKEISSRHLADVLLNRYHILIKDLSSKDGLEHGNFIRLSVKTDEENEVLAKALDEVLNG